MSFESFPTHRDEVRVAECDVSYGTNVEETVTHLGEKVGV